MCGIAGHVDFTSERAPAANERLARAMADSIRHRGPDGSATWSSAAGLWLAHRRLAIVDVSEAGAQPMVTPDGRGVICFNGAAYSAIGHKPELEAAGYRFRDQPGNVRMPCEWRPSPTVLPQPGSAFLNREQ